MTTGLSPLVQDRLWLPPTLSDKSLLAVITLPRNKLLSFVEIDSANSFIDEATSCFQLLKAHKKRPGTGTLTACQHGVTPSVAAPPVSTLDA